MSKKQTVKQKGTNFLIQGSILALAGIICRIIGFVYRMPMTRALGADGLAYYSRAFNIYNIALIISSYGMPLAVSKLVAAKVAKEEYKNERSIDRCPLCGIALNENGVCPKCGYKKN